MIELREAFAADRDAILALRRRCFPDEDVEKQEPAYWDWEFARGRMFVAAEGGRLVAHLGFVPQTWIIGGETCAGMLAVDAMTDPDARRQGAFTRVAAFARDALRESVALSTAFQIRDAVLPPMERNGWKSQLKAPVLVKVLTGFLGVPRSSSESLGEPVITRGTPRNPGEPAELGRLSSALLKNVSHVDRSSSFFEWRFAHPHYAIDSTEHAYVVTRRTTLRGYDTLAVADLGWAPGCVKEGRVLLHQVLARGRAAGIRLAAALLTMSHPALPALVRSGFLPSPHRFRFLVNIFDERIRASRARWALTWADTDHL